jgi:HAD superfamily hydrolase (TIGR01490 family)
MSSKNIIIFDMDNTLVSADTMDLWGQFLEKKGIAKEKEKQMRIKFNQDYHARQLDVNEYFRFETDLLNNITLDMREEWRKEFFYSYVEPKISRTGLRLIEEYKRHPENIVLLMTATFSFVASPVAAYAKVHDLIATEVEIEEGIYTGSISGIASLGQGKVERFKLWLREKNITPAYTVLYSDSINDLPLLNFVNKPIVTDPDKNLEKIALEKNWECISLIDDNQREYTIEACKF